eukprot:GHVN01000115.1.p1 GENE.GHVN01000115.1~~GHVN01000115.1.p1  ORF type:complete len:252 (-),score=26.89 GHVN01000115.1:9-665(-)
MCVVSWMARKDYLRESFIQSEGMIHKVAKIADTHSRSSTAITRDCFATLLHLVRMRFIPIATDTRVLIVSAGLDAVKSWRDTQRRPKAKSTPGAAPMEGAGANDTYDSPVNPTPLLWAVIDAVTSSGYAVAVRRGIKPELLEVLYQEASKKSTTKKNSLKTAVLVQSRFDRAAVRSKVTTKPRVSVPSFAGNILGVIKLVIHLLIFTVQLPCMLKNIF